MASQMARVHAHTGARSRATTGPALRLPQPRQTPPAAAAAARARPVRTVGGVLSNRQQRRSASGRRPVRCRGMLREAQEVEDPEAVNNNSAIVDVLSNSIDLSTVDLLDLDEDEAQDLECGNLACAVPEEGPTNNFKSLVLLNLAAALFGSTTVVIQQVEASGLPSSYLTAIRFAIAAAVFVPQALNGLKNPVLRKNGTELSFWLFSGYLAQAVGLATTTASRGAFTLAFTVLTVPLLVGFTGKKIPASNWAAAFVALIGVGLLTTSGGDFSAGDAWCIAAAVLFGVHKFRTELLTRETEGSLELTAVQLLFLVVFASIWAAGDSAQMVMSGTPVPSLAELSDMAQGLPWLQLTYMGLLTTAAPLLMEVSALKEVNAETAALIYTTEPLWGASFAWILAGDRWGAQGWVGAALIISSSLSSQIKSDDGTDGADKTDKNNKQ